MSMFLYLGEAHFETAPSKVFTLVLGPCTQRAHFGWFEVESVLSLDKQFHQLQLAVTAVPEAIRVATTFGESIQQAGQGYLPGWTFPLVKIDLHENPLLRFELTHVQIIYNWDGAATPPLTFDLTYWAPDVVRSPAAGGNQGIKQLVERARRPPAKPGLRAPVPVPSSRLELERFLQSKAFL